MAIAFLAFLMAGAGHGWVEGLYSSVAIVLAPLTAAAWAYRRRPAGMVFAGLALAPAVYVDWFLCTYTSYVDRVWQYMPVVLMLWILLWVAWQALALWVLLSNLTAAADRDRVVTALMRIARDDPSSVARTYAISELSPFLDDEAVRAFFHQLLLDPAASASDRQAAISCLPARPPTPEMVELCKQLLDDPLLAASARLRLKQWQAE
jgi:hypothetical protein